MKIHISFTSTGYAICCSPAPKYRAIDKVITQNYIWLRAAAAENHCFTFTWSHMCLFDCILLDIQCSKFVYFESVLHCLTIHSLSLVRLFTHIQWNEPNAVDSLTECAEKARIINKQTKWMAHWQRRYAWNIVHSMHLYHIYFLLDENALLLPHIGALKSRRNID